MGLDAAFRVGGSCRHCIYLSVLVINCRFACAGGLFFLFFLVFVVYVMRPEHAVGNELSHTRTKTGGEGLPSVFLCADNGFCQVYAVRQMRCNGCHRREDSVPGMETVNRGKELFRKNKCLVCHVVDGRGGLKAPELTYIGDKDAELFDFTRVTGPHTAFNWHVQHLTHAETISPGTAMPDFDFEAADARALALLLLSWRRESFPPRYLPGPPTAGMAEVPKMPRQPAPAPQIAGAEKGREVFLTRGCNSCHGV